MQEEEDIHPDGQISSASGVIIAHPVRKFTARLEPGKTRYDIVHQFGTPDVIVQTRIAGNIRDGGISILDEDTVRLVFGGPLHEAMDVVVIG